VKAFSSPIKNVGYFGYRMISPLFDPVKFYYGLTGYVWFIRDWVRFKRLAPKEKIAGINLFPILDEKVSLTPFDAHYFYQEIWAMKHILREKPYKHVDLASTYNFAGYLSLFLPVDFVDLRPTTAHLPHLRVIRANILRLPYKSSSLPSLSSLHVIEHIGLGRYGDNVDPNGTKKAIKEMVRVVKPGGYIYLSLPIGKYRLCFNAHRIHPPEMIIKEFKACRLLEFSAVDDEGNLYERANWRKFSNLHYGCGLFIFRKTRRVE
jgi:SAM-dependent methyltransferase